MYDGTEDGLGSECRSGLGWSGMTVAMLKGGIWGLRPRAHTDPGRIETSDECGLYL